MDNNGIEAFRHDGRRYLVTGGGSGIGRATSLHLGSLGARVAVADLDLRTAEETADAVGGAIAVELDVTERGSWESAVPNVVGEFGGLDGLVNNAGITRDRSLLKMTDAEWEAVIGVHLRGTWLGSQLCMPALIASGSGAIVNISSSGRHGTFGQSNYAAAKAGIVGLTKTVAVEHGKNGVRCNAVAPGVVETPMTDAVPDHVRQAWAEAILLRRFAEPVEIAHAIAFQLSSAASYITAQVLEVTGGEVHQ